MGKYVTKRVLLAIVTVFIVCGITFFAMNAIPGGPFDGEKALSPEVKEALKTNNVYPYPFSSLTKKDIILNKKNYENLFFI